MTDEQRDECPTCAEYARQKAVDNELLKTSAELLRQSMAELLETQRERDQWKRKFEAMLRP